MAISRRQALCMGLSAASASMALSSCDKNGAGALRNYPSKNVEVIAAGDAGGGIDIFSRAIQQALEKEDLFKRSMTITNLGGGGGNTAMAELAKKSGDAYTLGTNTNRVYLNQIVGTTKIAMGDDYIPIAQLMTEYLIIATAADSPYRTGKDVMDALKKNPKSVTFGVGTVPSDDQMNILRAADESGVNPGDLTVVAFKSGGDLMTQLLGGRVDVISTGLSEALEQYKAGKVRLLAITSAERQPGDVKDVPTWKELGVDIVIEHWRGVFGPSKMPQLSVDWWTKTFKTMTESQTWKGLLKTNEWAPLFRAGKDFEKVLTDEAKTAKTLLTQVGLAKQ